MILLGVSLHFGEILEWWGGLTKPCVWLAELTVNLLQKCKHSQPFFHHLPSSGITPTSRWWMRLCVSRLLTLELDIALDHDLCANIYILLPTPAKKRWKELRIKSGALYQLESLNTLLQSSPGITEQLISSTLVMCETIHLLSRKALPA